VRAGNRFRVFYRMEEPANRIRILAIATKSRAGCVSGKGIRPMTIASLAEVKARFSAYIEACKKLPIVVTKNGRAAAVLLSVADDDELESILLACSPRFKKLLERSNREIDRGEGIPHEESWKRAGSDREDYLRDRHLNPKLDCPRFRNVGAARLVPRNLSEPTWPDRVTAAVCQRLGMFANGRPQRNPAVGRPYPP